MSWIDWTIVLVPLLCLIALAIYSKRYARGVVDYLAAGRVAGRYVLCVGDMMAGLLSYEFEGEKKLIAEKIGKRIGRWIYIVDAFDDYYKDKESGSYNPFVELYSGNSFTEDDLLSISKMLEAELALAFSALELLDDDADKNRSEILKNILCLGMPQSVERICKKTDKNKKEEKKNSDRGEK